MFLGLGIIAIGPRRSRNRLGAKALYNISIKLQLPRFISHKKKINIASNSYSSSKDLLLSYVNTKSNCDGLPKVLVSFNPHKFKPIGLYHTAAADRSFRYADWVASGSPPKKCREWTREVSFFPASGTPNEG